MTLASMEPNAQTHLAHSPVHVTPDGRGKFVMKTNINECLDNPCHNGGTCSNNDGSFECRCAGGFTGALCNEVLPNIALGKPAKQSSTFLDYNAAYAVDGNRGTDLVVDKCAHTGDGDTNLWWRVDLQAVFTITSVRILNRGMDRFETGRRTEG
eukprot:XP_019927009.1 PREDICTED: protein jagged-2-like [Crassostrea gigas]